MSRSFQYAIRRGGKSFGIEDAERLCQLAIARKLAPQDYVYWYDRQQWFRAGHLEILASIFVGQTGGRDVTGRPPEQDLSDPQLTQSDAGRIVQSVKVRAQEDEVGLDLAALFADVPDHLGQPALLTPERDDRTERERKSDHVYLKLSARSPMSAARRTDLEAIERHTKDTQESESSRRRLHVLLIAAGFALAILISFYAGRMIGHGPESFARIVTARMDQDSGDSLPVRDLDKRPLR